MYSSSSCQVCCASVPGSVGSSRRPRCMDQHIPEFWVGSGYSMFSDGV